MKHRTFWMIALWLLAAACSSNVQGSPGGGQDARDSTSGASDSAPDDAEDTEAPAETTDEDPPAAELGVEMVSYFGGSSSALSYGDMVRDSATDSAGNWYVAGGLEKNSDNAMFTGASGHKYGPCGSEDAFVLSFTPGGALRFATVIGGTGYDRPYAIEVDEAGNVYLAGRAGVSFPTTEGVVQPTFQGDVDVNPEYGANDGFVTKLDASGALVWSTYIGSQSRDFIRDFDIDADGDLYLGVTALKGAHPLITATLPSFNPTLPTTNDFNNALIKLDSTGSTVLWAGYFGGTGNEEPPTVQVIASGEVFYMYATTATDVAITAQAFQKTNAGLFDEVLVRVAADGTSLVYATYIGTSASEGMETHQMAVNDDGEAVVAMGTTGAFGHTANGFQPSNAGGGDVLLVKMSADGASVIAATYLGGTGNEAPQGLAMDGQGMIYLSATTASPTFPSASGATVGTPAGGADALAAILSNDLTDLRYRALIGGSGDDEGRAAYDGPNGEIIIGGNTTSTDLNVTNNALQSTYGGGKHDAFFARLLP